MIPLYSIGAATAIGLVGLAWFQADNAKEQVHTLQAHIYRMEAQGAEQARRAEIQERDKEALWQNRHLENQRAYEKRLQQMAADAAAAVTASERLRKQAQHLASRSCALGSDPTSTNERAPAGDPIGVLADVLSRADARAGLLAAHADASRAAGLLCEAQYDSLSH